MGLVKPTTQDIILYEKIYEKRRKNELFNKTNDSEKIHCVIRWAYSGKDIFVLGDFNSWKKLEEYRLFRSGHEHIIIIKLSKNIHYFKFLVDGELRYSYDLPHISNGGEINNYLDLRSYKSPIYSTESEFKGTKFQKFHQGFPLDFPADSPALPILLGKTKCLMETTNKTHFPFHCTNNHIYYDSLIQDIFGEDFVTLFVTRRLNPRGVKSHKALYSQKQTSIMYATIRRTNKDFYPISFRNKDTPYKSNLSDIKRISSENDDSEDPYFKLRVKTTTELFAFTFRI